MLRLTAKLTRRFSSAVAEQLARLQAQAPHIQEKIKSLEQSKPYFDRLINFDPDYLAHIPFFFRPIEPFVEAIKNVMLAANANLGLPWWLVIVGAGLTIRLTIMPLVLMQMRRVSQLAPVSPVLVQLKNTYKVSNLPFRKRFWLTIKAGYQIIKGQNLKFYRLYIYNLLNIPIIITMVYAIRRLLSEEQVASTSLLHIPSLLSIDPYFIMPIVTVALYYWNFQRFITKENAQSFFSRVRSICQILLILWLPFLCYWPSGIVLYMMSNAFISVLQTTIFTRKWFIQKVTPKTMVYNYLLGMVEYDTNRSQAIIDSIRTGEQTFSDKAINEDDLFEQTNAMVEQLNKELTLPQEPEEQPSQEAVPPAKSGQLPPTDKP